MRLELRRRRFSRHIICYQQLTEGTQGGASAPGSEGWQAKRQLILPIRFTALAATCPGTPFLVPCDKRISRQLIHLSEFTGLETKEPCA
jgi:hypothetical protein